MEEAKTTTLIKVECTDQVLRLTQTPTIASGGVKEDTVEFAFDSLWDGFDLAAVFYRGEKEVYHVGIVDNRCIVPREVLANPGYFYLGVMGVKDGVTRTPEERLDTLEGTTDDIILMMADMIGGE